MQKNHILIICIFVALYHICSLLTSTFVFPENKEMIYKYLVNILTACFNVAISYNTHPRDQTSLKFEEKKKFKNIYILIK